MDKQEYKMRAEEIKALISKREFFKAVKIADGIDWTRVRSVAMLCTVSDLYKVNRRYRESKELLLMAYERHPNGRMILYSLCELCLKMGELVQAIEYYKEFVQLAPMDNGKYILQYKIYVAQEVSLEERIAVLEEFKKREYREKWGYELAYLYHRIGLSTKCVEECDELILWFSDGRYVKKAMELKMLHQPLTAAQEASYNAFIGKDAVLPKPSSALEEKEEEEIQVQPMKVGQYDTINLQKALAESMKEVLEPSSHKEKSTEEFSEELSPSGEIVSEETAVEQEAAKVEIFAVKEISEEGMSLEQKVPAEPETAAEIVEPVKEEAVAEPEAAVEAEEPVKEEAVAETEASAEPEAAVETGEPVKEEAVVETEASAEQEETSIEDSLDKPVKTGMGDVTSQIMAPMLENDPEEEDAIAAMATKEIPSIRELMRQSAQNQQTIGETLIEKAGSDNLESKESGISPTQNDQIVMAVTENAAAEKQTTGQMNIDDVLSEWEKTKKDNEEKRRARLTQKVLEQTGNMFTEFEEKVRDGILEQLQKEELDQQILSEIKENILGKQKELEEVDSEAGSDRNTADLSEGFSQNEETKEEPKEKTEEEEKENVTVQETEPEDDTIQKMIRAREEIRDLTEEERALFGSFLQTKGARRRFLKARDLVSLSAYTGNIIVTGEADQDTIKLAKNLLKDIQMTDSNFSGVIAKVTGSSLNSKSVESTIQKLNNGGLIIEKASGMNAQAVAKLLKALNQEETGIVIILEDSKKAIKRMMAAYPSMSSFFNAVFEIEELNNDALAAYGRQYAAHLEYSIDDLGMLALQTKIEDRQTSDHIVTVAEVRELVDDAIYHANRKNLTHLFDLVLGKRYDDNDMIILREKDFI